MNDMIPCLTNRAEMKNAPKYFYDRDGLYMKTTVVSEFDGQIFDVYQPLVERSDDMDMWMFYRKCTDTLVRMMNDPA